MEATQNSTQNKIFLYFFSLVNAFFLVWFTFFSLSYPYALPDEYLLVQTTSVTKNLIFGLEQKPDTNRFLFVNVAWDKILADKFDPQVPDFPIGKEPITDRNKLIALLDLLAKKKDYAFVVLDINFKGKTEYDSILTERINQMPRLLVSYHRDDKDKPDLPDLKIKHLGLSDMEKVQEKSLKFKIFHNDSIKSTPLLIYETLYKKKFKKTDTFYFLGDKPVLNSFILDYRIRNFDYTSGKYSKVHLGEWIDPAFGYMDYAEENIDEKYLNDYVFGLTKGRIVFVGDFEDRDIHQTIYGNTPGPMILLDAFLALEAGDNVITWQFLTFLFILFLLISYITFGYDKVYGKWLHKITFRKYDEKETFFESLTVYLIFFALMSISSYFLFNIHIGVLVMAFYMNIMEKVKGIAWKYWFKEQNQSQKTALAE